VARNDQADNGHEDRDALGESPVRDRASFLLTISQMTDGTFWRRSRWVGRHARRTGSRG
jgi:hypothetical protein